MSKHKYILMLALVAVVALLIRLWLWNDQGRAGMVYPGDQDEYYRGAVHLLLEGSYYDEGQWLRPPITSLFLAGVFALVGINVPLAMLAQCVVSVATLPMLAEIARRCFGSKRAGVLAALGAGLFLPYASYASQLYSETLFIFMVTASLLLFEIARQRGMNWRWLLAGGMVWGLAVLTRPVGLYAVPLLMAWAAWAVWVRQRERRERGAFSDGSEALTPDPAPPVLAHMVGPALALLVGFVLVVAPWSIRNTLVYDHVVLVDTNGGVSFWLGNLLEPDERELQAEWNRTISNSAERQQVAFAHAVDNIQREPLTFLKRMRYKVVSLWQFDTRLFVSNDVVGITLDEHSLRFALVSDMQYAALMVLAVVGLVLSQSAERSPPLIAWTLYGTLLSAVSLGHPRLRLPLLIAVFVYAALVLAHPHEMWRRLRAAAWGRWAALLAGLGVLAFLFYASAYLPFARSMWWLWQANRGGGEAVLEGKTEALMQRAIEAAPDNYLPYVALADLQSMIYDLDIPLAVYEQAAERAPRSAYIHLQRLDLNRRLGNEAAAQQAMGAIDAVGWDNNQLYAWAWNHTLASAQGAVRASDLAPGLMRGMYAAEREGGEVGRAFRWTMGHAEIRLGTLEPREEVSSTSLYLMLRADAPDTPVRVSFQRSKNSSPIVQTFSVGTSWEEYALDLGAEGMWKEREYMLFDGIVEIDAPLHVASVEEPYPRGVAWSEIWIEYDE